VKKNARFFRIAAVSLIAAGFLLAPRARALFGFDVVIDPTAIGKLAQQIAQYQQMIAQYSQMANTTNNTFNMWKQNFVALSNKQTWKSFGMPFVNDNTQNVYGETANWSSAVNFGAGIPQAWTNATLPVNHSGPFLSSQVLGSSAHLSNLASIEASDGTALDSMSVLAGYRQMQTENATALNQLEQTALSQDPNNNTLIGQQNITNAALMQQLRSMQANGTVAAALLQQQLIANTYQRNAAAETLNTYNSLAQSQANGNAYPQGWADSLTNYQPQ
jgi:hypothetical protein